MTTWGLSLNVTSMPHGDQTWLRRVLDRMNRLNDPVRNPTGEKPIQIVRIFSFRPLDMDPALPIPWVQAVVDAGYKLWLVETMRQYPAGAADKATALANIVSWATKWRSPDGSYACSVFGIENEGTTQGDPAFWEGTTAQLATWTAEVRAALAPYESQGIRVTDSGFVSGLADGLLIRAARQRANWSDDLADPWNVTALRAAASSARYTTQPWNWNGAITTLAQVDAVFALDQGGATYDQKLDDAQAYLDTVWPLVDWPQIHRYNGDPTRGGCAPEDPDAPNPLTGALTDAWYDGPWLLWQAYQTILAPAMTAGQRMVCGEMGSWSIGAATAEGILPAEIAGPRLAKDQSVFLTAEWLGWDTVLAYGIQGPKARRFYRLDSSGQAGATPNALGSRFADVIGLG